MLATLLHLVFKLMKILKFTSPGMNSAVEFLAKRQCPNVAATGSFPYHILQTQKTAVDKHLHFRKHHLIYSRNAMHKLVQGAPMR